MKRVCEWKYKATIVYTAFEANASGISGKGKRHRFHPVVFVAFTLLTILVLGLVFHAIGYGVQRLFVSWDDETMNVSFKAEGNITWHGYENGLEPAFNDAFFQKLEEMEITPLLPSWMPEGMELVRVESKIETEYLRWAVGTYLYGDKDLLIYIKKITIMNAGGVLSLEKDEREPDIFEQGGIKFYVMDNLSRGHAYWYDPPYEVEITGHVTREEIRQMIKSMFERK